MDEHLERQYLEVELYEKIVVRERRRKAILISLASMIFLFLCAIPVYNERFPKWESLKAARNIAVEIQRIKTESLNLKKPLLLSVLENGMIKVERVSSCNIAPGQTPIAEEQLYEKNWINSNEAITLLSETDAKKLKFNPSSVFFSSITYGEVVPFGKTVINEADTLLLVTGIANPKPLILELEKKFKVETISFSDHHNFTEEDIERIHQKFDTFASDQKAIITTEKDFMRLSEMIATTEIKNYPWFYQTIQVKIDREETFNNLVYQYVDTI